MRRLTDSEFVGIQDVLTGSVGEQIRLNMFDLALGRPPRDGTAILSELDRIGWVSNGRFTELGKLLKDPLREYGFWIERAKALPSEDCVTVLNRQRFSDKRLLELGCGGGCNLLSLAGIPRRLVGLEPMPLYLQMCAILSEMAGVAVPELIEASAENIPLSDNSFDVVICYSSHQYMDINKAVHEMSRVLAPGGEMIIVGNSLGPFVGESIMNFFKDFNLGRAKFNVIAVANTLFYQVSGRRIICDSSATTTTPIYPSRRYMLNRLKHEGLSWNNNETCVVASGETVLVANKPLV